MVQLYYKNKLKDDCFNFVILSLDLSVPSSHAKRQKCADFADFAEKTVTKDQIIGRCKIFNVQLKIYISITNALLTDNCNSPLNY
jgi:hypothetical protein